MSADKTAGDGSASAPDGVKAQFLEALERKKTAQGGRGGTGHGDSKIHGTHGKEGAKRQFRRKAGG